MAQEILGHLISPCWKASLELQGQVLADLCLQCTQVMINLDQRCDAKF